MTFLMIVFIEIMVVFGGEFAKYDFGQDIGEIFPDQSGKDMTALMEARILIPLTICNSKCIEAYIIMEVVMCTLLVHLSNWHKKGSHF